MPVDPSTVLVLVCPQCGKKYKGDPNRPDARYECPVDQSTLIRLDMQAIAAVRQARQSEGGAGAPAPAYAPAPTPAPNSVSQADANGDGASQDETPTQSYTQPYTQPVDNQETRLLASTDESQETVKIPPPIGVQENPARELTMSYAEASSYEGPAPEAGMSTESPTQDFSSLPIPEQKLQTQPKSAQSSATITAGSFISTTSHSSTELLSGFEQRRSVVAALERMGGTDPITGQPIPVYKYEMKGKLGQGGMGEVHKVLDRDLRREVALKMLRPRGESVAGEEDMLRFIKEAQATGRLEHPNIVPVHDLGIDADGRIYFTLKYVKGVSLKEVIRGRRDNKQLEDGRKFREVWSPRQMIEILISICNAMAYAHSKDILHRDLKPDNIMLGKFGEVLVMDWGLAKILTNRVAAVKSDSKEQQETFLDLTMRANLDSSMTMEGAVAGTPAYMAPEQAAGKISELDERTDVYSLGAMLYEILSGEPPYKGNTALEVVRKVNQEPPPSLQTGMHGFKPIPRELKAICEKAMTRDSRERYATAQEMRNDLQAYLEDQPVSCCSDTPLQKSVKWIKRNRHRVTASATTAAAILAVVLFGWFGYKQLRVHKLLSDAQSEMNDGRMRYNAYKDSILKLSPDDPYRLTTQAAAQAELANTYRESLQLAVNTASKALDVSPGNNSVRSFLAQSYMELWRLALAQNNDELMSEYSNQVLLYAPNPEDYSKELEGLGNLELTVVPEDAEVYLFRFENLRANDQQGNPLPSRLIPVPFNLQTLKSDDAFLLAEQNRARNGEAVISGTHSIFRLDPSTGSRLGSGKISFSGLPPGSYMLLLTTLDYAETRVPFKMDRMGTVNRRIEMPLSKDILPGFFYVAGGDVWVGGESANALPRQKKTIAPFLMYHDEINMGDYAQFLKGVGSAAKTHMPRDFGKPLAVLTSSGLAPANGGDADKFAQSPVRGISYNDVMAYIDWRSKRDGVAYRLPTEIEWEGTCRGTDGRKYSWGNQPGRGLAIVMQGYGDSGANISWKWEDYKDESPFGVHNLAGGVAEWTSSLYDEKAKPTDPVYGQRAIRGDAWSLPPTGLQCAFRTSGQPDYFHPTIGFRLATDWPVKRTGTPQGQSDDTETHEHEAVAQPTTKPAPTPPPRSKLDEALHKLGLDK
ncbi:MAG TPA: SUMF1/EgtB/PvdO family nonheme iron enzyme [Terriglobales bacterium]|jgi:serine/threonine protein kinase/formylglycine-generating enzyme required for sulfatase activity|nr:SUMF1/EgtB/PvdO family nonheme iron enzyme [Terriglobales bacterium]